MSDYAPLPDDLPVPVDDGVADGLVGREVPDVLRLAELAEGLLVACVYPLTGMPGEPLPHGWDDIPGACGRTPQSCACRDALADFEELGATVVGRDLHRRLTFIAAEGRVVKAFPPVFPVDRDAGEMFTWLRDRVVQAEGAW